MRPPSRFSASFELVVFAVRVVGAVGVVALVDEDDSYQCADNTDGDHHELKRRRES